MKTEIYGTLGPKCNNAEILSGMFAAGMTGIRLNLSHITLEEAGSMLEELNKASEAMIKKAKLLIDMQGPELRIGSMPDLPLEEGTKVRLGSEGIPLPSIVMPYLQPGQELLLDDGKILLRISEGEKREALVMRGGLLKGRKSLALPGISIHPPALTEEDRENIAKAGSCGVYGVMQPFVRSREDLSELRQALNQAGAGNLKIFAKIENAEGVRNLKEFMEFADEIIIARGDLGNSMPLWELPRVQKEIAAVCRKAGKPFMVVTQMLASMEHSAVPTRAEVSDIFNAVLDGASSVMVTGETAAGSYPVETIRYLANTAREAEKYLI